MGLISMTTAMAKIALLLVALSLQSILAYRFPFSRCNRWLNLYSSNEWWLNRDDELVIDNDRAYKVPREEYEESLFDQLYKKEDLSNDFSIAKMTLRDISESYQFSLPFLGDFAAQMDCAVPLDVDTNIGNYMNGDQVHMLLQALTSLDPLDSNAGYDSITVDELADNMNLPTKQIVDIANGEGIGLPFGVGTVLHVSSVKQIMRASEYDKYNGIDVDSDGTDEDEERVIATEYENPWKDDDDDDVE